MIYESIDVMYVFFFINVHHIIDVMSCIDMCIFAFSKLHDAQIYSKIFQIKFAFFNICAYICNTKFNYPQNPNSKWKQQNCLKNLILFCRLDTQGLWLVLSSQRKKNSWLNIRM